MYKIKNLETGAETFYSDKSFCTSRFTTVENFNNRWRKKTSAGIVVDGRWYITKVEVLCTTK